MKILSVDLLNLRNIASTHVALCEGHNLFFGANGAGKTSFLEAVHLLGYGRSFRTRNPRDLIQKGATSLTVSCAYRRGSGEEGRAGISKSLAEGSVARLDGETLQTASRLAAEFPLIAIEATSAELFTGGPAERRQAIDWGVFHVEPSFADVSRSLKRVLWHRNALLKHRVTSEDLAPWDEQLIQASEAIDSMRAEYFARVIPEFIATLAILSPGLEQGLELELYRGWSSDRDLREVLIERRDRDLFEKRTTRGAHSADLRVSSDGVPVKDRFSRGQLKVLLIAFKCAQAKLYNVGSGNQCAILLDDLAAELDQERLRCVVSMLDGLGCQTLQTYTEAITPEELGISKNDCLMFHVKQGSIEAFENPEPYL